MSEKGVSYEKACIEAILKDNTVYYTMGLEKRDFHDAFHRVVFATIGEMLGKQLDVDEISICEYKPDIGAGHMTQYHPTTSANAAYYADGLKARTRKRELVALSKDLVRKAETERDTRAVIDFGTTELLRISEHRDVQFRKAADYLMPVLDALEKAYHNKGGPSGLKTGFYSFDDLAGGLMPGQLVIIAARTSIGKTTFALNVAQNMARNGHAVGFFSCEMTAAEMLHRMISSIGLVPHTRMVKALMTPTDFVGMTDAAGVISEFDLWLDDTPSIHWHDLRNRARVLKTRGMACLFIDYLTLVRYGEPRAPRHERIGMLTQEIKALARELSIPVVVMSQLNRESEQRPGTKERKPSLGDLRQSGEIEENSDIVILLHRDRDDPDKDAEMHIAKYRGGPTGKVDIRFDAQHVRFVNKAKEVG